MFYMLTGCSQQVVRWWTCGRTLASRWKFPPPCSAAPARIMATLPCFGRFFRKQLRAEEAVLSDVAVVKTCLNIIKCLTFRSQVKFQVLKKSFGNYSFNWQKEILKKILNFQTGRVGRNKIILHVRQKIKKSSAQLLCLFCWTSSFSYSF